MNIYSDVESSLWCYSSVPPIGHLYLSKGTLLKDLYWNPLLDLPMYKPYYICVCVDCNILDYDYDSDVLFTFVFVGLNFDFSLKFNLCFSFNLKFNIYIYIYIYWRLIGGTYTGYILNE